MRKNGQIFGQSRRFARHQRRSGVRLESLEARQLLAADVIISEVLASNDNAYQDEDGSSPDYIELFNMGSSSVNLDGWHLTDRLEDRARWTFPSTTLDPAESLVVFASGKDRADAGAPLHTNFKVSAGGEYVALYEPDGRTVAFEFDLPEQFTNVSYGIGQSVSTRELVSPSNPATVLVPASSADEVATASWTATDFDDSGWTARSAAVGFDDDPSDGDFGPLIDSQLADMRGSASSAYLRTEFEIAGETLPIFKDLGLELNFDDGFVAYLNGHEVAAINAPATPAWDSLATQANGGFEAIVNYASFPAGEFTFNGDSSSADGVIHVTPSAENQTGAVWRTEPVTFGSDYTFSASMVLDVHSPGGSLADADGDGIGGQGIAFVLQSNDNNVLGSGGSSLGLENTGSTFLAIELDSGATGAFDPDDSLPSHIGVNTSADGNVGRTAIPRFNGNSFSPGSPGPGVIFQYLWVEYQGDTTQLDVYYGASDAKPAEPTLSVNVDLREHFGGAPGLFAGWTASTNGAFNGHDVHAFDLTTGVGEIGRDALAIDLSEHIDKLQTGTNVLALHGMNVDVQDEDFLLVPKLTVAEVSVDEIAGFFASPTPGSLNGVATDPPSGPVEFSVPTQIFTDEFAVEITAESGDAVIRYTTDGTLPNETSELYVGPITVSASARLRARTFEPERSAGPTSTVGYTQAGSQLRDFENGSAFESNLPIIVIDSFGARNIHSDTTNMVPAVGLFIEPGEDGRASIFDEPSYAGRVAARKRGQTSEGFAKKQYAMELIQGETDDSERARANELEDVSVSLFGLPSDSDWVINGPYSDKSQLNNYLTFLWSNKIGQYAPRARLVELFINSDTRDPGQDQLDFDEDYRGTYVLLEKIKAGDDRVDIASLDPGDADISGGYMWKKDKTGAQDLDITTGVQRQGVKIIEPSCSSVKLNRDEQQDLCLSGEVTDEQIFWLKNHLTEFEEALYGPNFMDPVEGYAKYIDVDSWADTWLLVEFTKNIDGFRLSTYYHKDRGGKIKQGPAWDYNLSLGNANYLQGGRPEGWYGELLDDSAYPYWRRLFQDPAFEQAVADRWFELRESVFKTENILADIDAAVDLLSDGNPNLDRPAEDEPSNPISRNFARWNTIGYGTDKYHWPNCFFAGAMGDRPASPLPDGRSPETYGDVIFLMKRFVELRAEWIDEQFSAEITSTPAPGVVPAGSMIEISAPAGHEIYYTLDGSDPEQPRFIEEEEVLIGENAPAEFFVPSSSDMILFCDGARLDNPEKCIVNPDYELGTNGEAWTAATLGLGYDSSGEFAAAISTDISAELKGENSSVYVRVPFEVTAEQLAKVSNLVLDVRYDDAFVAYLWRQDGNSLPAGEQMAKGNVVSRPSPTRINTIEFNAVANEDRDSIAARTFESFSLRNDLEDLRVGQNYLVFQAINDDVDSEDFLFDVRLRLQSVRSEESPSVLPYNGPIAIDQNTQIVARGFDPGSERWTRALQGDYIVNVPELRITELNYNPSPPTQSELEVNPAWQSDDFEFVEIRNAGDMTINLAGTQFDGGITYEFGNRELAPNELGVLVKNLEAFQQRYGTEVNVIGEYGGNLDNNGERVVLTVGSLSLLDFTYDDADPWSQTADGGGATLELINEATPGSQLSEPQNWRGSTDYLGSPGAFGSSFVGIVINEVLSRTDQSDAIELFNISGLAMDVGGWHVSDSADNLQKYRIPDGTIIDAFSTLVLTEAQFNSPADPLGFGLNGGDGDDVWLTITGDDGSTNIIVDSIRFDGSLAGESLGRYPNGIGRIAPMTPSLGTPNTYPRVGPVVISELQYNPAAPSAVALNLDPDLTAADLEYVEIHNPTPATIELTDWRLRGGVDYDFDLGAQLQPNETVVITPFNPATNADRTAAFRVHYGLNDDVRLVGGYQGQLSGDGERVTLLARDRSVIDVPDVLPTILEDEVVYDDSGQWPIEADGSGASLNRRAADQYGNLSTSWVASQPSPGQANYVGEVPGDFDGDGIVDVRDVDRVCQEVHAANPDVAFDLDGNGSVGREDLEYLIETVLRTGAGDADLNGVFDSRDLVEVFIVNEYADSVPGNSTWAEGDWNCDQDFDSEDIVHAFIQGSYLPNAVPQGHGDVMALPSLQVAAIQSPSPMIEQDVNRLKSGDVAMNRSTIRPLELIRNDSTLSQPAHWDQYFAELENDDEPEAFVDDDLLDRLATL